MRVSVSRWFVDLQVIGVIEHTKKVVSAVRGPGQYVNEPLRGT